MNAQEQFLTLQEIVAAARRNLAPGPWNYLAGATETETTMRRNRQALDSIAFRPRVLNDVSKVDSRATFLGKPVRLPVMLAPVGGMESFAEGGYARTPIGDLLPVNLDKPGTGQAPGPLTFDLDREGWLQAWARLRENEADERTRLSGMPPLTVLNRVRGVKAGAGVIATAKDANGNKLPALAVQRFGRGRSAAMMLGDLWRWGMRSPEARVDLEKSWRQMIRWLVADVPGRVALAVEPKPADPDGSMEIQARVSDAKFLPVENAAISITVEPVVIGQDRKTGAPTGDDFPAKTLTIQAVPSATEPGLYTATYLPRQTGGFKATARAVNAAGAEEGRAVAGWATRHCAMLR